MGQMRRAVSEPSPVQGPSVHGHPGGTYRKLPRPPATHCAVGDRALIDDYVSETPAGPGGGSKMNAPVVRPLGRGAATRYAAPLPSLLEQANDKERSK
ncbi:hypothetical protein MTO96_013028 [Rhipicephalus appendiculatus]